MWIALTRVGLPVMEEREVWKDVKAPVATGETKFKEPGEKITKAELKELGWTDEKIDEDMAHLAKYNSVGDEAAWEAAQQAEQDLADEREARIAAATAKVLEEIEAEQAKKVEA